MLSFRPVRMSDAERLAEIQYPYVRDTAITFLYSLPDQAAFEGKIREHLPHYPFIVCEEDGKVIGFAYASKMREQEAYLWDAETTIYLDEKARGRGVGQELYSRLLRIMDAQGFLCAYACITQPNNPSMHLHDKLGFREVGTFPLSGWKLGQWHTVAWLVRMPENMPQNPVVPIDFLSIPEQDMERLLGD